LARKPGDKDITNWRTDHEIKWLEKLGSHARSVTVSRMELLRKYKRLVMSRVWDRDVEVGEIMEYLDREGVE
jgi:hypothetical protein